MKIENAGRKINVMNHAYGHYENFFWNYQPTEEDSNKPLQWRHNEPDGVLYHRRLDRSKKTPKLTFYRVNSTHKGPVTRKMFPFDDVIMLMNHADGHYDFF